MFLRLLPLLSFLASFSFGITLHTMVGFEADSRGQGYSYAGVLLSPQIEVGIRGLVRVWVDRITYKFGFEGETIRSSSPGYSLVGGVGFYKGAWFFNIFGGWERRDVNIFPYREGVRLKGRREGGLVAFETGFYKKESSLVFIGSYTGAISYVWTRLRYIRRIARYFSLGGELVAHGNKDYRALQSGGVFTLHLNRSSFGLRAGYKGDTVGDHAYFGLEVYFGF